MTRGRLLLAALAVLLVAAVGVGALLLHGTASGHQPAAPPLPGGRLALVAAGDGQAVFQAVDETERTGDTAHFTTLVVVPGGARGRVLMVVREIGDCGRGLVKEAVVAHYDEAGRRRVRSETAADEPRDTGIDRLAASDAAGLAIACGANPHRPDVELKGWAAALMVTPQVLAAAASR